MIAVAVNTDYGKRGIGGMLTKLLVENIKKRGYWRSFAECSSAFSARALLKHGGVERYKIPYQSWEYRGANPLAKEDEDSKDPHTSIKLVVFKLKE